MKHLIITLIFLSTSLWAGSRFGFQNITFGNLNAQYSAAGNGRSYEIAHDDSLQLNFKNPSTWTNLSRTTLTINGNYNSFYAENSLEKSFSNNSSFAGVFIGIPLIRKQLNFGVGLQQFSSINQKITGEIVGIEETVKQDIIIKGGLSKASFNIAYKIDKQISASLGYEYTFGRIDETGVFSENAESLFNLNYVKQVKSNGLVFGLFSRSFPNLNLGIVLKQELSGSYTTIGKTVNSEINNEIEKDLSLPTEINIGAEYKLSESYYTGIDLLFQNWENGFKIDKKKVNGYTNYYYLGLGLERVGSARPFINYYEQISYRMGLFVNNLAQTYEFKDVTELGISFGISLPIQRFRSKVDLSGFVSKRGDLKINKLEETIVGFKFSVSANELWFVNLED